MFPQAAETAQRALSVQSPFFIASITWQQGAEFRVTVSPSAYSSSEVSFYIAVNGMAVNSTTFAVRVRALPPSCGRVCSHIAVVLTHLHDCTVHTQINKVSCPMGQQPTTNGDTCDLCAYQHRCFPEHTAPIVRACLLLSPLLLFLLLFVVSLITLVGCCL